MIGPLLRLPPNDHVLVARATAPKGTTVAREAEPVRLSQLIPHGA